MFQYSSCNLQCINDSNRAACSASAVEFGRRARAEQAVNKLDIRDENQVPPKLRNDLTLRSVDFTYPVAATYATGQGVLSIPGFDNATNEGSVEKLEKETEFLKRAEKKNNTIVFGLEEKETSTYELLQKLKENLKHDLNINIEDYEVNKIYRLGTKNRDYNKPRPVLCSFTSNMKKNEIIKNKKNLKSINISEDYSKEVLEKRKTLQAELAKERKRGDGYARKIQLDRKHHKTQIQLNANTKDEPRKWLTKNTVRLLEERNHLIKARDTQDRRKHLTKISKEIKDSIRKDKKKSRMEIIEAYISKTGGVKKAYKELKNSNDWIVKMKDDTGKWNHRRTDILGIATSYYKKLYKSNPTTCENTLVGTSSVSSILQVEVEKAIVTQSVDKTPGPDGISNEFLRNYKEVLIPVLTEMFNTILNTEIIPQQWTESTIILLYKKGDKHDIGNYRLISLMSNIYKIFAMIILKRIERTLDEHQPIEQAGFRKDYSVIEHIHVVRQVLEKRINWQNFGINIDGESLTHLRFADDIVLFAKTFEDMKTMIEELATESEKIGLKLNPDKTRVMTNGKKDMIQLGNTEINYTDEFIYLGQLITQKKPMREEVKRRITNSWRRYWSLREVRKDEKLNINIKSKLYNTCIYPF
ncbi:uncharacterized protein LOC126976047 [Leptidea sinapis]|uniref:uncharacterized protein LOC126976047 n=1 Tax=Leptidea sinapis TaxID=189913 RepID=UPI0021C44DA3|nr:uncharacterized protein LOC126976047 [Leptidea sinapis]